MINQSQHYQLSLINKNHNIKVDEDSNNPYKKEKKIQHFIKYKKKGHWKNSTSNENNNNKKTNKEIWTKRTFMGF